MQVSQFYASEPWPSLEPHLGNSGTYGELRPHGVRQLLDPTEVHQPENGC